MVDFSPSLKKYNDRWEKWRDEQPNLIRIRNKLLNKGGYEVVPNYEPDAKQLLDYGIFIENISISRCVMQSSQCHRNARNLFLNDDSVTEIGTGWGLSDDGLWRQHSWCMREDELVETTQEREVYFGILINTSDDAYDDFIKYNK